MADLEIRRGDDATENVTIKVAGSPVDLDTATSITFTAKRRVSDTTALITKNLGDGLIVIDAPNGVVQIQFYPADTLELPPDAHLVADIQLVTDITTTVWSGDILVLGDVTTP